MGTAIRATGLAKRYLLSHQRTEPYGTLRDALQAAMRSLAHRFTGPGVLSAREEFWALQDVGFEVEQGSRVGIIGRNGAGKSTLLKILSRITPPSQGAFGVNGRVASLLEVGTGFHPELTGRENIYLNGSILGLSKAEIARRFDEIVAFAEVEKFLDTPVKRYSSGMFVRLGFAVAAHVEADILIVDEVLAVGDAAFQRKCFQKIGEVTGSGRTVLLVSHNMAAVRSLCDRAIWMHGGRVAGDGEATGVIADYMRSADRVESPDDIERMIAALPVDPAIRIEAVEIRQAGQVAIRVANDLPVEVSVTYVVKQRTVGLRVYFDLLDEDGSILIRSFHDSHESSMPVVEPGRYTSVGLVPAFLLAPRTYEIRVRATIYNVRTCSGDGVGISLDVGDAGVINRAYPGDAIRAKLQPRIEWSTVHHASGYDLAVNR